MGVSSAYSTVVWLVVHNEFNLRGHMLLNNQMTININVIKYVHRLPINYSKCNCIAKIRQN